MLGLFDLYSDTYSYLIIFVMAVGVSTLPFLIFDIEKPVVYGRHDGSDTPLLRIPTRVAWVLMECPASLVFAYFFFTGPLPVNAVGLILFGYWQLHYIHRSFIYPFHIRVREGSATPVRMFAAAMVYCSINGYLNGVNISVYGQHLQSIEWLYTPQFIIGSALFFLGYYWNKKADYTLIGLRKNNPNGGSNNYVIPQGGLYKYITCPNYFGEIITWIGFALASWTLAGAAFALFTALNLLVRAKDNHKWYVEKFPDYPKNRKIIIPFLF